jgi:hypothetical protein
MSQAGTILAIQCLAAWACFWQSLELLALRREYSEIWTWPVLRTDMRDFPRWSQRLFQTLFEPRLFTTLLAARLIASIALPLVDWPWIALFLLFSTALIAIRWRGSFNGGSDFMTVVVLSALTVAAFSKNSTIRLGCLWYITIQTTLSYFIAGTVKVRKSSWRSGMALDHIVRNSIYGPPPWWPKLSSRLLGIASSLVLTFELLFPISLLNPSFCLGFLAVAAQFHLMNFWFLGLNRFVWAWLAAYPAVVYCSLRL